MEKEKISRIVVEDPHGSEKTACDVTTVDRETAIAEHDEDINAHPYIRGLVGNAAQGAAEKLSAHNESEDAHLDIREQIREERQARVSALENHNENNSAHQNIQQSLSLSAANHADDAVATHNGKTNSHPDIRELANSKIDEVFVGEYPASTWERGKRVVRFRKDQFGKVDGINVNGGEDLPIDEEGKVSVPVPTTVAELGDSDDYATKEYVQGYCSENIPTTVEELSDSDQYATKDYVDAHTPTTVAELSDSDDYATKADAQAMVDAGKIATATAEVDNTVGIPRVTPIINGQNIHFDIRGIKGEKGNDGDTVILNPTPGDPSEPDRYKLYSEPGGNSDGAMTQKATTDCLKRIEEDLAPISGEFDNIPYLATFDGVSSEATCTPFTLQSNGDYIEVEVWPGSIQSYAKYALANNGITTVIFSVSATMFFARPNGGGDFMLTREDLASSAHFTAKVVYEDGNVKFYRDGTLVGTYTGQKPMTISRWGHYYYNGKDYYWGGKIGRVTINGTTYKHIGQIPGWSSDTVTIGANHGFLTDEQYNMLAEAAFDTPEITVSPSESGGYVDFITKINGVNAGVFKVKHFENDLDDESQTNPNEDMWRLETGTLYYYGIDRLYHSLNKGLLTGAENEFAINIQNKAGQDFVAGDFIGGYHGNERIAEEGDYVKFFVDGKAYTFAELVEAGRMVCTSAWYEEVTTLYDRKVGDHRKIGKHYKKTIFGNGGYKTTNYVAFDFSALTDETVNIVTAFVGLVCVHKDCASIVTNDIGTELTATHPSPSTSIASHFNKYSRRVFTRNGNLSCQLDSKILRSNIDGFTDSANPSIEIYDRANDIKYYSYLPTNYTPVNTGKYVATECEVKFNYKT